jgi:hypothetical protein
VWTREWQSPRRRAPLGRRRMICHDLAVSLGVVRLAVLLSSSRIRETISHALLAMGDRAWRKEWSALWC